MPSRATTSSDADLDLRLGGQFYLAHRLARAEVNARLAELGIDLRHFGALGDLAAHGRSKQGEVAVRTGLDRSSAVYVMDTLEAAGLVQRERAVDDRRSYAIRLTEKGRRTLRKAERLAAATMAGLLAPLSATDRRTLSALLATFLDADRD